MVKKKSKKKRYCFSTNDQVMMDVLDKIKLSNRGIFIKNAIKYFLSASESKSALDFLDVKVDTKQESDLEKSSVDKEKKKDKSTKVFDSENIKFR